MIDYLTAGESHGPQLTAIITGVPAGLTISLDKINAALAARQVGYGRGLRQKIEHDTVEIESGVRHGQTIGSPITLVVQNRDHANWGTVMDPFGEAGREDKKRSLTDPRPGHADLVGGMKYGQSDLRNILERSSARETAIRVAVGNVCEQLLAALGIRLCGFVRQLGPAKSRAQEPLNVKKLTKGIQNDIRCFDPDMVEVAHQAIDEAKKKGDTLGGIVRIVANGVPAGLGSHTEWNTKLDGQLAGAVMGVNAVKGVSFGIGFDVASVPGSKVMDEITWDDGDGYSRASDHLGGFEGGMTNGMPIVVNAAVKPIPTLTRPLKTVNILNHHQAKASRERSDTSAVVPASLVIENVVAITLARAITDTFDSNNLIRLQNQLADYRQELRGY